MATMVPAQKNSEYIFYITLVSQADVNVMQSNPTLAAGDATVITDGNAVTNLDTLPVVDPPAGAFVQVTVSATEMNGDNVAILFHDAAGDEWCDLSISIQTSGQSLDAIDTNVDDIETMVTAIEGTDLPAVKTDTVAIIADTEDIQTTLGTPANFMADLSTLETRLSAIRAGYLDQLDFALQEAIAAIPNAAEINAEVDAALAGFGGALEASVGIVSAKVDTLQDDMDDVHADTAIAEKILTGKWEITGNQLVMYDDDGITPLYTFDLKNAAGAAASTRIFSREPA